MAYSDEEKREMWQKEADKKGMHFIQKHIQLREDLLDLKERMGKRGDLITEAWMNEVDEILRRDAE